MSCDVPVRQCLAWHFKDHLVNANLTKDGESIRARCPACDGHDSLIISKGTEGARLAVFCHGTGCDRKTLRDALIKAGVPQMCVPRLDRTKVDPLDAILAAVVHGGADRAAKVLRVAAIASGHRAWPEGKELEALAEAVDVSRTTAYRAKQAEPLIPPHVTSRSTCKECDAVKNPKVGSAFREEVQVSPETQVSSTRLVKVSATRLAPGNFLAPGEPVRRGRKPKVTPAEHVEFHRLRAAGTSLRQIGRKTGYSDMTVAAWLKKPPPALPDPERAANWEQQPSHTGQERAREADRG
jgi:hypothetical protein